VPLQQPVDAAGQLSLLMRGSPRSSLARGRKDTTTCTCHATLSTVTSRQLPPLFQYTRVRRSRNDGPGDAIANRRPHHLQSQIPTAATPTDGGLVRPTERTTLSVKKHPSRPARRLAGPRRLREKRNTPMVCSASMRGATWVSFLAAGVVSRATSETDGVAILRVPRSCKPLRSARPRWVGSTSTAVH